ncbi:hypothetical protein ACFSTE_05895 [Aquimarina hainanensis]|uniref:DUF4129 domain-containing protein n=1 Tax=Aquimarina hainanensis TaxID=1578017 RepID=A0ABW5N6E7_9FLAO
MNPILVAKAAQTTTSILSNRKVQIAILLIILYLIFRAKIKRWIYLYKQRKFNKDEALNPNQLAQQYRAAANPSGISWLINADGTNERQIENLAYQSKNNFQPIANAYNLKFEESLTDRLRKELSPKEYQDWHNIVF